MLFSVFQISYVLDSMRTGYLLTTLIQLNTKTDFSTFISSISCSFFWCILKQNILSLHTWACISEKYGHRSYVTIQFIAAKSINDDSLVSNTQSIIKSSQWFKKCLFRVWFVLIKTHTMYLLSIICNYHIKMGSNISRRLQTSIEQFVSIAIHYKNIFLWHLSS